MPGIKYKSQISMPVPPTEDNHIMRLKDMGKYAKDSDVVKLTGDQTVSGEKTFANGITASSATFGSVAIEGSVIVDGSMEIVGGLVIDGGVDVGAEIETAQSDIDAIKTLIPTQASDDNQLADKTYVDDEVASAKLAVQLWLPAVESKMFLPSTIDPAHTWLCRVIADPTASNNGVWQAIPNGNSTMAIWTYFSDNLDFVDDAELAAALNVGLTAETGLGSNTDTPAVAPAPFGSILQTIWNKIRQISNVLSMKQNTRMTVSNAALYTNAMGDITASTTVTATELGYLDGVTSSIQTQLNAKVLYAHNIHLERNDPGGNAMSVSFTLFKTNNTLINTYSLLVAAMESGVQFSCAGYTYSPGPNAFGVNNVKTSVMNNGGTLQTATSTNSVYANVTNDQYTRVIDSITKVL